MHRKREQLVLQWMLILIVFIIQSINVEAGSTNRETKFPLPESSTKYSFFQGKKIKFDNIKLFRYAQLAIDKEDYATAETNFLEAIKFDSGSNRAKLGLVEVYEKQKEWDKAITICDSILTRYPYFVDGYMRKAALAVKKQDIDLAIKSYKSVIKRTDITDKTHVAALKSLGELCYKKGDYKEAENYEKQLLSHHDSLETRMILAECAVKQKKYKEALEQLDIILPMVTSDEQKGKVQLARGFILYKEKDFDGAYIALEETLRFIPETEDRLKILKQLGDIAYQQKKYGKAEKTFKICLAQKWDEDTEASYIEVLIALEEWGQVEKESLVYINKDGISEKFRNGILLGLVQVYKHQNNFEMTYKISKQAYERTKKEELLS